MRSFLHISSYIFVNWFCYTCENIELQETWCLLSVRGLWLFVYPVKEYYAYCGSVRPVVASWEFWCPEFGKIHIIDMKMSSWLQMFCVFGGELCYCTVTDWSHWYWNCLIVLWWTEATLILVFNLLFVRQHYASRLFVMTAPATVQSDSEVLLLVTSVMLGRFNGQNLLLEVVQYMLICNVPVGLIFLYIVCHQTLLETILPP